ncbi:MAG: putative dsRNA-binding protein [Ignavibacteriales bacterium]
MEVFVDNISYGTGEGKNKKTAEQNAAQDALVKIGENVTR